MITPTTGTESDSCSPGSAADVAALQATRISFTPCAFEVGADLVREPGDLRERPRPVRQARAVAQVDEVLVRHRHETLVQDGQAAHARVEDADRTRVHRRETTGRGRAHPAAGSVSPYPRGMAAIRIGTCSWADEGLVKRWYPRGVSSPAARLAYYAERFDTVEVDSPFYHLPSPETAAKWAERTPDGFVFHAKASGEMTGHREADREEAFAAFREALAPLEEAGKLRGVLLQYPPRFVKSREALDELAGVAALLDPLVPLIEFRHRSWVDEDERADTFSFLERHGLAYVSVDSPRTRASNVLPRIAAATHPVAYVRFHGRNWRTWNLRGRTSAERFDWLYDREELEDWVEPLAELSGRADEVYALFNNNRYDYAPRSARVLRGLLDEREIPATGGIEPPATGQLEFGA